MNKHHTSKNNIYLHPRYKENVTCTNDGSETLLEQFLNSVNKYKNKNFLGTIVKNELKWLSYNDVKIEVEKLSSFFNTIISSDDIIGIFSVNRYEWLVSEYAGYMSNSRNCPLYSTFGPEAIRIVIEESEMKICCCSKEKAKSLKDILKICTKSKLKYIIVFDNDFEEEEDFREFGIKVYYYNIIIKTQEINLGIRFPQSDDVATICYTSGTSGIPKGVILTHKNFISNIAAYIRADKQEKMYDITNNDVYLSYLPLAHVMERLCINVAVSVGGSIGFYRGNPKELQKDYLIIKPTFIIAVPRVLDIFKQNIELRLSERSWFVQKLVKIALKYKIWRQGHGVIKSTILDFLIFNKISKEFGGKIKACLCGAAPLKIDVLSFLQGVLSIKIFQGYGQTETTGATIVQPLNFINNDNVGIPFPSNKIKLLPVDGYDKDCGELLVKGDNVTQGYFRRPEETKALFDDEGWLKTGDIVRQNNGIFNIIGRSKEIFKTSFGEYIVPEKLENLFIGDFIEDMFVTCLKYSNKLICIVVCKNPNVSEDDIFRYIQKKGNFLIESKKIAKFEVPSNVIVIREGFDTFKDEDFLTATAKKKRTNIEKYFKNEINKFYDD